MKKIEINNWKLNSYTRNVFGETFSYIKGVKRLDINFTNQKAKTFLWEDTNRPSGFGIEKSFKNVLDKDAFLRNFLEGA